MTQQSYSTLWDGYATDKDAKQARDTAYKAARKAGKRAWRTTLSNQVRPYVTLGVPDGRSCTVYLLDVMD